MLSFFPRDILDEIWDLIESVSEGFATYSRNTIQSHENFKCGTCKKCCHSAVTCHTLHYFDIMTFCRKNMTIH